MLAALPQEEVERIIKERSIPAHTDRTMTRPDALINEIAAVRERGWGASMQELNENNAVAAPVAGRNGGVALILLVLGFAEQLGGGQIERTGEMLVELGRQIRSTAGFDNGEDVAPQPTPPVAIG